MLGVYELFVKGLEFYGYHGVPHAEQAVGHRYVIDLTLEIQGSADETDEVTDTVDYGELCTDVLNVATAQQYKTIEKLAKVLCDHLLEHYAPIQTVSIQLAKKLPPAAIIAESAGVSMIAYRDSDQ